MPALNDARLKKTSEKKADLGQTLAKRRSQDFASKIQGWNEAGGGIVSQDNEVTVVEERTPRSAKVVKPRKSDKQIGQIALETETIEPDDADDRRQTSRPATPKTPGTPINITPKASGGRKIGREVDISKGAWVRRKSKPQVDTPSPEVKGVGAPKKRVISDGHWRKDKPKDEPKPTPDRTKDPTPKPIIIRRSIPINVGMKVPASHQDFTDDSRDLEPPRVRAWLDTYPKARSPPLDASRGYPDYETSGTKVYIKRRRVSRQPDEEARDGKTSGKSESSFTALSSDKPSSATDITTPSTSPPKDTYKFLSESRQRLRKVASREAEREADQRQRVSSAAKRRSKTPVVDEERSRPSTSAQAYAKRITETLKKAATPPEPVQPAAPKIHGNRIEGWLANMPDDPFTETRSSSTTLYSRRPAANKPSRTFDAYDDGHSDEYTRPIGTRRRSSRQEGSQQTDAPRGRPGAEEPSPSQSGTLRRQGARRKSISPLKRDRRKETPEEDAMMSGALPNPSRRTSRELLSGRQIEKFRIPSGARPLSTILSVDTPQLPGAYPPNRGSLRIAADAQTVDASVLSRASDGDSPRREKSGLKRRSTKHEDLMSVLSLSRDDSHAIASARSIRASRRRTKADATTIGAAMNDLSVDELKYQRELRTLVDGVIPVLLQHALSDKGSIASKRVFSRPESDTGPIVDMGVALEKLKTMHKRIPMHEPGELLTWAEGAAKLYSEYLRAWRLGFKNIVINLAPAERDSTYDGLPRNKEGDLVDGQGERVDVAYLLKRPLVRIKYLSRTFKLLCQLQPSVKAENMFARYTELIADAKRRVNDEQARLEDEAAAAIDATRARDPRNLGPIGGVIIDPTRSVRARDYFDMDMTHSSGQQLGCKIELIYRDDAPDRGKAGDVLFCEVSTAGRWLLFPPMPLSLVSAREGEQAGELVLMVRGFMSNAQQWRELMVLQAEDEHTAAEWLPMLGASPIPPRLSKKSSFNLLKEIQSPPSDPVGPVLQSSNFPRESRVTPTKEIEVPIGERLKSTSRIWDGSEVNSHRNEDEAPARTESPKVKRYYSNLYLSPSNDDVHEVYNRNDVPQPAYFYDQPRHDMDGKQAAPGHKPGRIRSKSEWTVTSDQASSKDYSVWLPSSGKRRYSDESASDEDMPERQRTTRPGMHRRTSSVPSLDMPTIPKVRQPKTPGRSESPSSDRDLLPSQKRLAIEREADPTSAPAKMQMGRLSMSRDEPEKQKAPLSAKSRPFSLGLRSDVLPSFTPAFLKKDRRPSSPLKHEYEPSTASDSLSESDLSDLDGTESVTSESDVDYADENFSKGEGEGEGVSTVGSLNAFQQYTTRGVHRASPPTSLPVLPENSLDPSESASQAPYRTVPPTSVEPGKTVACLFSWSERFTWDSVHPEECQIFVTPGLIEAFDIAQANAATLAGSVEQTTPSSRGVRPLVALELTPLVPLRRGTAVDISIRSPPTTNSVIRNGDNIMFRSRTPEECEKLYNLINRARIDNPTYIALQNARGPVQQSNWGEAMDRRNSLRPTGKSWLSNLGSKMGSTYRSKGSRTASVAATESSVGTVGSAFSALRRFSAGSRFFDLAKSTIQSKTGTRSTQSESLSSGVATPLPLDLSMGTPLGITNSKVRLYVRETAAKWRDLGSARLNVLLPPRLDPASPPNPKINGTEKRVMLFGKSKGETLLDVTLGESAFERVARTGIAVSVYQEMDHVGRTGGVMSAKTTVYMIQMKSERDAAYTFGLGGKLRY